MRCFFPSEMAGMPSTSLADIPMEASVSITDRHYHSSCPYNPFRLIRKADSVGNSIVGSVAWLSGNLYIQPSPRWLFSAGKSLMPKIPGTVFGVQNTPKPKPGYAVHLIVHPSLLMCRRWRCVVAGWRCSANKCPLRVAR